jgi:hypothetical protein
MTHHDQINREQALKQFLREESSLPLWLWGICKPLLALGLVLALLFGIAALLNSAEHGGGGHGSSSHEYNYST